MAPKELFRFLGLLWPILSVCWGLGGCCCGDSVALDTTSSLDGDTIAVTFDVDSLCDTYRADPSLNGIVGQCVCDISPKQLPPDSVGTFPVAGPVASPAPEEPVMDSVPLSFDAPCPTYPQPASYSETYWAAKYGLTVGPADEGDSLQSAGQVDTLLPNATVFGWHPYWMGSAYREYNFSLLSTVAYFSYELDQQTGGYTSVAQWKSTGLIDAAHQYGTRVLLTVSSCGELENAAFLSDPTLHQVLADSLIALLQLKNGDGVALAFQQVPASASTGFSQLVATLRQRLQEANPNFQLVVAVPGSTTLSAYRIRDLQPNVDYFVINGYNYHHAYSAVAGPLSPLRGGDRWVADIDATWRFYAQAGMSPQKAVMAFPYFGLSWNTAGSAIPAQATTTASLIPNHVLMSEGLMSEATTGPSSQSSYVLGNKEQWWFETPENLNTKYQWVRGQQLAGVGIWALGFDNGYDNWWQVLRDNFSTHASPLPADSALAMDAPADSAGTDTSGIVGEVVALASKLAVFMVDHSSFWQQLRLLVAVLVLFVFILLVQACLDAAVREALEANAVLKNVVLVLLIGLPLLFLWLLGLFASVTGWALVLGVLAIVGGVYLLQNVILKPVPESC